MGREIVPCVKDTTSAGAQKNSFLDFAKAVSWGLPGKLQNFEIDHFKTYVAKSPGNRIYNGRSSSTQK